jgi:hypothetical protein
MTTTAISGTTTDRRATTGLVGGALWALLPLAWLSVSLDDVEFGTLSWLGVIAAYWIFAVLPPVLIVVGLTALRRALGGDAGRTGRIGIPVAAVGLGAMSLGLGIEVASFTAGGGEVALGHAVFLIGFLVTVVGSVAVGIVVLRRRRDLLSRVAGLLMVLALPLGIGIGLLGSVLAPENDAAFFAAISVPTGIAWVLLGRSLTAARGPRATEYATAG